MERKKVKGNSIKKQIIKFSVLLIMVASISLYITLNTRVVSYNGNGATSGKMGKNVVCFNKDSVISKNNYTKEGFNFKGWSVYNDKSEQWKCEDGWYTEAEMEALGKTKAIYSEDDALEVIKNEKIKNITLFAQWLEVDEELIKEEFVEGEDEIEISIKDEFLSEEKPNINEIVNQETVNAKKDVIAEVTPVINQNIAGTVNPPLNSDNNTDIDKPNEEEILKPENDTTDLEKLRKYFIGKDLYYLLVDPYAQVFEFIDDEEIGILGKDILIKEKDKVFIYIKYKANDYKIKYHEENVNNELEDRENAIISDEIFVGSIIKEQNDIFKIEQITEYAFRINGFTENGKNLYKDKAELVIPSKITGNNGKDYFVVEISNFSGYNFKKIIIEDGILKIADETFRGNTALQEIILPNTLTNVGKSSFLNTGIRIVRIPNGVQTIEDSAFYGCVNLESVILSEGLLNLKSSCFSQCTRLNNISLPQTLVEIGAGAFNNCQSLYSIDIPANVQKIGTSAFAECMYLSQIVIPGNVKQIEDYTFVNCMNLNNIIISEGVTSIGNSAFENCTSLTQITIPGSVKVIGEAAFRVCSSLKQITISEGVTNIGNYAFALCMSLEEIKIPSTITSIGNSVFMICMRLSNITIQKESIAGIYLGNGWYGNCFQQTTDKNGFIVFYDSSKYQVMSMSLDTELEENLEETEEEIVIEDNENDEEIIDENKILETEEILPEENEVLEENINNENNIVVEEKLEEKTDEETEEPKEIEIEQETIVTEQETVGDIEAKDIIEENVAVPDVTTEVQEIVEEVVEEIAVEEIIVQPSVEPVIEAAVEDITVDVISE